MVEIERKEGSFIDLVRQFLDKEQVKYSPFTSFRTEILKQNAILIERDENNIRLEENKCEIMEGFGHNNKDHGFTDFIIVLKTETNIIRFAKRKNSDNLEIRTNLVAEPNRVGTPQLLLQGLSKNHQNLLRHSN